MISSLNINHHQPTKNNQMKTKKTPNTWSAACFSLHYVICDGCVAGCDGKGFSRKDAIYLAKKDGWKQVGDKVLCPTCAEEAK